MLIEDEAALQRLNSPMNLINRLRRESGNGNKRKSAMSLFGVGRQEEKIEKEVKTSFNPFQDKSSQPQSPSPSALIPQTLPQSSSSQTTLDNILENHDSQIKLGLAHDNALALLNDSVKALSNKLDEVRADRLPAVISAASKTVESIRKERAEANKNNKDREVHYHFYTPEQKSISEYEVIDVA